MDPLSKYESLIDQQIREAAERGEFDDLPGAGKPLPGLGAPDDELWWLKGYMKREGLSGEALLPPSLQLRAEVERLPDTVRDLPSEQAVREVVADLNRRIADWLRSPTGPHVPIRPARVDEVVERWRAARQPATAPPAPEPPAPRQRRWWRRRSR
jgi:DnaJ-like protein